MSRTTKLIVALCINALLVVIEVSAGIFSHSSALVADAGHNLTDVAALGLSLLALRWALRPRSEERSFGNHRGTILSALASSAILGLVGIGVIVDGARVLANPHAVNAGVVVAVAAVSAFANLIAALLLRDKSRDLNLRTSFVHMGADVVSSTVVLVSGAVILVAHGGAWNKLDPIASIVIAILIVIESVRLSKESVDVLLESTPSDVDLGALREVITSVPSVLEVHDLHVWSLSSELRALSAHLVLGGHPTLEDAQAIGGAVRSRITTSFNIAHTTFELECERCVDDDDPCAILDPPIDSASVVDPGLVVKSETPHSPVLPSSQAL
ncbi:MAG: cation diffusion facilitator family transporter [Actinobacteria bacterium]|nr:cation diffusion facilitator family transporter [Actinomycetota bacterium]